MQVAPQAVVLAISAQLWVARSDNGRWCAPVPTQSRPYPGGRNERSRLGDTCARPPGMAVVGPARTGLRPRKMLERFEVHADHAEQRKLTDAGEPARWPGSHREIDFDSPGWAGSRPGGPGRDRVGRVETGWARRLRRRGSGRVGSGRVRSGGCGPGRVGRSRDGRSRIVPAQGGCGAGGCGAGLVGRSRDGRSRIVPARRGAARRGRMRRGAGGCGAGQVGRTRVGLGAVGVGSGATESKPPSVPK